MISGALARGVRKRSVRRQDAAMDSGFTLIEVLIVVAIIAIIAAVLIPNFFRARAQALVAASKSHMRGIANALESYWVDNGAYPPTGTAAMKAALEGSAGYVAVVPQEPCTGNDYIYILTTPEEYTLSTPDLGSTSCAGLIPGNVLYYRPGSGFSP